MPSAVDVQAGLLAGLDGAGAETLTGTCLDVDWKAGLAQVNVAGAVLSVPMLGVPVQNDRCRLLRASGLLYVLGPVPHPAWCTVKSAPSGGMVQVTGDDSVLYVVATAGQTLTAGQRVVVEWTDRGGVVQGIPAADPLTGAPISGGAVQATGGPRTVTFNPTASGTQNGSGATGSGVFWTGQVYCSDSTVGAYFYGTQIASTIPDSAAILGVSIAVAELSGFGDAATFGTHPLAGPTGPVTVSGAVAVSAGSGAKVLPNSFGDLLKTGAAYGIGTNHGGYRIYGSAAQSGALTITWQ